ncbi:MAG TPA: SpoIIIAH-like family protein [Bacillaceae bacterium]
MLLKKQTVWLLTMLSLVVVLSVYYVTADPEQSNMAGAPKEDSPAAGEKTSADKDAKVITGAAGDEVFETMRLEQQEKRSKLNAELTTQLADPKLSAEQKSELYAQQKQLTALDVKEKTLESLIKNLGYNDVLVRADQSEVKVTVKSAEHSREDAAEILRLVRKEIGTSIVATVQFQTN